MNARQRKNQIRQQQKRREKRRKLTTLSPKEIRLDKVWNENPVGILYIVKNNRTLAQVNHDHKKDFVKIVQKLSHSFQKEPLEVLDEGCGTSSLFEELPERLKDLGINARVTRTDIDKKIEPTLESPIVYCSPEKLLQKFGYNRFHLIISTFGGFTYTVVNQTKAIANILAVLKQGGEAHILTAEASHLTSGRKLSETLKILQNRFRQVEISLDSNPHKPSDVILTIKKLKTSKPKS